MNLICLSIDGLHSGMLGAFGNTWLQTPTFDTLAAQSAVFDRFYAETLDVSRSFYSFAFPASVKNRRNILVTDDTDIYIHALANEFSERHRLESFHGKEPVLSLEETQFFKAFAAVTGILDTVDIDTEEFFLHLHLEGFRQNWDFPLSYRRRYQAEEDPMPYPLTALPDLMNADPDMLQSVLEAYSGGVAVLDDALAGLIEYLDYMPNTMLVITAPRGFSLGEHRKIGIADDYYSENIQLPLLIRYPKNRFAGSRSQTLLKPQDLPMLLSADELPEEPADVHPFLRIGHTLLTPDWFLTAATPDGEPELYVKPDDRWEYNNVAVRCPQILEELKRV